VEQEVSFDQTKLVWINGTLVPWNDGVVHVSAHGLHYGTGVFEGIRCYETADGAAVFRMEEHLDRLYASAAVYGLNIPYIREQLSEAVCEVVRENRFNNCYVRPLCYFGSQNLGVRGSCPVEAAILAWEDVEHVDTQAKIQGLRLTVSPWMKFDTRMIPTTAKACGQYLNSVLAVREENQRGFDDALLLNSSGNIAEASVANVFLVRDGRLLTNDETSSILPGITRKSVIQIAGSLGYEVEIRNLSLEDLWSAHEMFLTGTAVEVVPVREVDGTTIGDGMRGPVTQQIQVSYMAATRDEDIRFRDWLRFVEPKAPSSGTDRCVNLTTK
jgi:branched-chain amino acid aminotransferase